MAPNRVAGRVGRAVPLSGITKPVVSSGVARPIVTAVPAARPVVNAAPAQRPISKPAAVFGAGRRARPLSSGQGSFVAAASFKRARTTDSMEQTGSTSVLGKHTRSGRTPRSVSPGTKAAPVQVPVAAASFLDKGPWTRAHAFYSGYFESELLPHAAVLVELLMQPRRHRVIFEKHSDRKFLRASEFVYQRFKLNSPEVVLRPMMGDVVPDSSFLPSSANHSRQAL
ncbi:B-type cyclin [Coemansia sp. RSA 1933]|nr:B-type cyclin [Coemansia sp. RSA 1933]